MVEGISDADRQQIQKLRELVKDEITPYYDTDFNLLRWLKGHNYNFDDILPKLRNHLMFRKSTWKLDSLADKPRNHPMHSYWQHGLTGASGKIPHTFVNVEQTGANDYWGILYTFPLNEVMKGRVYDLELMLRRVMDDEKQSGKQASIMYIMDLTGMTFDKRLPSLLTGALASISAFMSEHYVELIHTFVLVNVPTFISTIWTIAKPLLPERTKNKVKILGGNWKQEILEFANADVLPVFWNSEGETTFKASILRAVPPPQSGYYSKGPIPDAQKMEVSSGRVGFINIQAEKGQKLSWNFQTDGHFAYAVFYSSDPDCEDILKMKSVYPRFNKVPGPTYVPLNDSIECQETGTYKIWFSNEHAWLHTLKIEYIVKVESQ